MAKHTHKNNEQFVFKRHASVGANDAIEDRKFLAKSFVDNGDLAVLSDMSRPECIILGRTGSGKTALIEKLDELQDKVLKIPPEGLALTYVANNNVLNFFVEAGVKMDLFYRLLWRHVFAVELIREHYQIINEQARDSFLVQIRDRLFRNKARQDALDYIVKWGESLWKDSEYRVKEVTQKLEEDLGVSAKSTLEAAIPGFKAGASLNAEMARSLSEEQKTEIVLRGQSVVDSVQIKKLSDLMNLLENDILDDKQQRYYIAIDRLDENWVNDDLRYHLIAALLETVREFNNKIQNVKIIVAVREDLLDRVFRYSRYSGYQEEKYKSLYLRLSWTEAELIQLLDLRVSQLIKEQYTKKVVTLRDILPPSVDKQDPLDYIISRTLLKPRDAIMFFNECIRASLGTPRMTQATIHQAEGYYSQNRLRALADEWSVDYPNLFEVALFLRKYPTQFKLHTMRNKFETSTLESLPQNQRWMEYLPSYKRNLTLEILMD